MSNPASSSTVIPAGPPSAGILRRMWSPYAVGVAIGVLSWLVFAIVDKPLGISTSISAVSGACVMPIVGRDAVAANPYWAKTFPKWDYGMLFLVGTFLGALVSSIISGTFRAEAVPEVWRQRFGPSVAKRLLGAFLGGILILYGARMAGGCTSGHGISGSLQLAASSWTFFLTMFASGVVTAMLLFGGSKKPST
jgi:uncharacterized membrane protein YedE/YeeE